MMGASIKIINKKTYGPEIVGDIVVKSSLLEGIDIP